MSLREAEKPDLVTASINPLAGAPRIDYTTLEKALEPPPAVVKKVVVEPGDTLESILRGAGLAGAEVVGLVDRMRDLFDPKTLKPGQQLEIGYGSDREIEQVALQIQGFGEIVSSRSADGFLVEAVEAEKSTKRVDLEGTIESTLYDALVDAGASPVLIDSLYDVFQWDIDFYRLRRGDWFRLVIDENYSGEDRVGYGPVLGALFRHQGVTYEAFLGESPSGVKAYYTRDGSPVRKQFLKAPLKAPRITSGYTKKRFHPVLKTWRPHLAIDYGAPVGTPVMSTADGIVRFAGHGRAEGNYVRIRHNLRTETYYLHLSRFAEGIRKGVEVKQGQVVGYVGATGMVTGAHLDYRIKENGKFINPLEVRSMTPDPLEGEHLDRFRASVAVILDRLDRPSGPLEKETGTLLASLDSR